MDSSLADMLVGLVFGVGAIPISYGIAQYLKRHYKRQTGIKRTKTLQD